MTFLPILNQVGVSYLKPVLVVVTNGAFNIPQDEMSQALRNLTPLQKEDIETILKIEKDTEDKRLKDKKSTEDKSLDSEKNPQDKRLNSKKNADDQHEELKKAAELIRDSLITVAVADKDTTMSMYGPTLAYNEIFLDADVFKDRASPKKITSDGSDATSSENEVAGC